MHENTFGKLKLGTTVAKGDVISSAAVKLDGSGDLIPCVAETDNCVGIVHNATNFEAGQRVDIDNGVYQKFIAQGAVSIGDDLTLSVTVPGALKVAVSTNKVVGFAMGTAADGETCSAHIYTNKTTLKA